MTIINRTAFALAINLLALLGTAYAQTPRMTTVNITPEAERVRISAVGDVSEMRVDVADEQGEVVFQSGQITGQQLDWQMTDSQGERVAAGTYLVTVTFRTAAGKLRKRVEQVTVAEDENSAKGAAAQPAAPAAAQATITGAGTAGKISKFTGASTIANSVITESAGKIGIGTSAPASTLTVAGMIQTTGATTGGIKFPDNTIQKTAAIGDITSVVAGSGLSGGATTGAATLAIGAGKVTNTHLAANAVTAPKVAAGQVVKSINSLKDNVTLAAGPNVTITPSGNMLTIGSRGSQWTTIGSNIFYNTGNVSIGTSTPSQLLHIKSGSANAAALVETPAGHFAQYQVKSGATSAWIVGTQDNFLDNALLFRNGSADLMVIRPTGKVGIGVTTNPEAKLEVDGGSTIGVLGKSTGGTGVRGRSTSSSPSSAGVYGTSDSSVGVRGESGSSHGVYGTSTSGYAGYFEGKAQVTGNLEVGSCTGCSPSSDRNLKANFSTVNPRTILDRLATIPIQTWNYKSEPESVRHIGAMAQDFRAAFGLGTDDKTLNTVDAQGVTMAAIQGLYQQNQELTRTVQQQSHQIEQLQDQLNQVKRTIKRKRTARR